MDDEILLTLSPLEKKVLPLLELKDLGKISEKLNENITSVKRALQFLANKGLVIINSQKKKIVDLDANGVLYLKNGLPERKLINLIFDSKVLTIDEAKKKSGLSENEFKIALGVLKEKKYINIVNNKLILSINKKEVTKKLMEENFLEELPLEFEKLNPEQKFIFEKLKLRKNIVFLKEKEEISFEVTTTGKKVLEKLADFKTELIEQLTPEILKKEEWKKKAFRKYDLSSKAPLITGGKRHIYLKFLDDVKKELLAIGFQETQGPMVELSFFNCDALFMPQNHPARGIHDLYFLKPEYGDLSKYKGILKNVKKVHEKGGYGSEGWHTKFSEKESSRLVLRSQGTAISARILAMLGQQKKKIKEQENEGKYFSIARCFRPDIIDASHNTEFNQLEGIVIGKVNFRNLLYLLKLFAEKIIGSRKIKFLPTYFPFTEPSVEGYVFHEKLGWLEVFPAGIFRPELTQPLGIKEEVLAWGIGIDRLFMIRENINDIRQIFSQDINFLRKK